MKRKICLKGLDIERPEQLTGIVKKLMPRAAAVYKEKEKYFAQGDMYKYRLVRYRPRERYRYSVSCLAGVQLVSDRLLTISDIIIKFDAKDNRAVIAVGVLLCRLLRSGIDFILCEPSLKKRCKSLRGGLPDNGPLAEDALAAARRYLPQQVYSISHLWAELIKKGPGMLVWRQLRVKLRRLRSSLSICKPLLPAAALRRWQSELRAHTAVLSKVREYDVAVQAADRMGEDAVPRLAEYLAAKRAQAAQEAMAGFRLNKLTHELALLLVGLYSAPAKRGVKLRPFFKRRFALWYEKLGALAQKEDLFGNMQELHALRISLKKFRYALEGVSALKAPGALLRRLKRLQDLLGRLHDGYVNKEMLGSLNREPGPGSALAMEAARFIGWQEAKDEADREKLPPLWAEFSALLENWRKKNF